MHTIDAALSFLFFFMFTAYAISQLDYTKPNYELYNYQLANDIWRCLYLTDALYYFSSASPSSNKAVEDKINEIYEKTGLCVYLQGVTTTSCRGMGCSESSIRIKKVWFENFAIDTMQFTVCVPK